MIKNVSSADVLRRLAQSRDPLAWEELLELHGDEMHRLCRRICQRSSARAFADDAVQEALLTIRDRAQSFDGRGNAPDVTARAWILRVTANTALMLLRKQHRESYELRRLMRDIDRDAATRVARTDVSDIMEQVACQLAHMKEEERAPIILRFFAGFDYEQLSQVLGCPVGTAKTRVHFGLKKLREQLGLLGVMLTTGELQRTLIADVPKIGSECHTRAQANAVLESTIPPAQQRLLLGLFYSERKSSIDLVESADTFAPPASTPAPQNWCRRVAPLIVLAVFIGVAFRVVPRQPHSAIGDQPRVNGRGADAVTKNEHSNISQISQPPGEQTSVTEKFQPAVAARNVSTTRLNLHDLIVAGKRNEQVFYTLFPERRPWPEEAKGSAVPWDSKLPSDAEYIDRIRTIVLNMLGSRLVVEPSDGTNLVISASDSAHEELRSLLETLALNEGALNRRPKVTLQVDIYPAALREALGLSRTPRIMSHAEFTAFLQNFDDEKPAHLETKVSAGTCGELESITRRSFIRDFDASNGVYDPVIDSFAVGFRGRFRCWPGAGLDCKTIALTFSNISIREISAPQIIFIQGTENDGTEVKLPIELPNVDIRTVDTNCEIPVGGGVAFLHDGAPHLKQGTSTIDLKRSTESSDPKNDGEKVIVIIRARIDGPEPENQF
jgi:RNA polymerase sigma-70 factor (ECF subfamily)